MQNVLPSVVKVVKVISLEGLEAKKTGDCFKGYGIRNSNFDTWFPGDQSRTDPCEVTLLAIDKVFEMGDLIETLFGVPSDISVDGFAKDLQRQGHVLTLTQIEATLKITETLSLNFCDYHSFTVGAGDHLYLSIVHRHGRMWNAFPREIRWRSTLTPGSIVIIPNFDYSRFM